MELFNDSDKNTDVLLQLETYMDEVFISKAFNSMGENVVSVKVIKNKHTGWVAM